MKLGRIILFIVLVAGLWYMYGDTFSQSGFSGVTNAIQDDFHQLEEKPIVRNSTDTIKQGIQKLTDFIHRQTNNEEQTNQPEQQDIKLSMPSNQLFSIHNIEIGDSRSKVEKAAGKPKRSLLNEYGVNWNTYHDHYQAFFMVAYNKHDKVAGLYTNQDLISSEEGIALNSAKEQVRSVLQHPIDGIKKGLVTYHMQNNGEYDIFHENGNYITIFYDKHEDNTVTAIQIIDDNLEKQRKAFFPKPSDALSKGFSYQLFDLTNAIRVRNGISPLQWAEAAKKTAQGHSADMALNNYFSHASLNGKSPFDRMHRDGIKFWSAGENIATGQTSSIFAHEGLMNSSGHRKNILKKDFRELAVGVAFGKDDEPYYTEDFLTER